MAGEPEITLPMIRERLTSALVSDALDRLGYRRQSPALRLLPWTGVTKLVGRAKTTLWADMAHDDPRPYELELRAVDSCQPDDVIVCATGGSTRSAVWGELLSTAARNRGCGGVVVDGAVRDVAKMTALAFPCFALATNVYDSLHRQRVIDIDVPVELGGVTCAPGELVIVDLDGMVVIPRAVEAEAICSAWQKAHTETRILTDLRLGLTATEAFRRHGTL
ncbi:MAG: RraA family protein [Pirellulales bacterium]|nr:RraA family protein [Pirellulales bacterium]